MERLATVVTQGELPSSGASVRRRLGVSHSTLNFFRSGAGAVTSLARAQGRVRRWLVAPSSSVRSGESEVETASSQSGSRYVSMPPRVPCVAFGVSCRH